jgi:hypothetical protein
LDRRIGVIVPKKMKQIGFEDGDLIDAVKSQIGGF